MLRDIPEEQRFTLHCSRSWKSYSSEINHTVYRILSEMLRALDNKFQKNFCVCDEYVINLFVCIYEVRNGTLKKLLGSSFKIMLHYDIL
jgi:hypothetical protein